MQPGYLVIWLVDWLVGLLKI